MTSRILVNGTASEVVPALDRGLAYGDGLFESIRFVGDRAPLWSRHMQRLHESCRWMRMPEPDPEQLWIEALQVSRGMSCAVVRITLTRGLGERGYVPPANPKPTRVLAAFTPPAVMPETYELGVRVRVCDLRLADQPLLAGMKHLNRLEQVLARAEWTDPAIAEAVLCDSHEWVISATMANLFVVVDGVLLTPAVDRCGVAGVARAEILDFEPQVQIGNVSLAALRDASEIFLSSSVRGIVPVRALGDQVYAPGPVARRLQQHWQGLGFSMEQGG